MAKIPTQDKAITIRLTPAEKKEFSRHAKELKMRDATAARYMVVTYMTEHILLTPKEATS